MHCYPEAYSTPVCGRGRGEGRREMEEGGRREKGEKEGGRKKEGG